MRPIVGILVSLYVAAAGATAQESTIEPPVTQIEFDKRFGATIDAQSDWFMRFLNSDGIDERPVWQAEPNDDFSVLIDNDSRWALNFEVRSRPRSSPLPREEMKAGATFKITPRFSIGGDVSVGAEELDNTSEWEDQDVETGIRLRSAFKF